MRRARRVCAGRPHALVGAEAARAQVSLFDRIIESKEDAHFTLPFVRNKYKLLDQVLGILANSKQGRGSEALDRFAGAKSAGPERKPDALLERDAGCGASVDRGAHLSACAAAVRVRSGACCIV